MMDRQIELAKSILESHGYTVTKMNESADGGVVSTWVEQLSKMDDVIRLEDMRENMVDGSPYDAQYTEEYDTIAEWLGAPEDKIYFIDLNSDNDLVNDIFRKLAALPTSDRTRLGHEDIDKEDEGDGEEYHAGIGLWEMNSTGELFVSGTEYWGSAGEIAEFFWLA